MNRRSFVRSSLGVPLAAAAGRMELDAAQQKGAAREYYVLRRYHLTNGAQRSLTDPYLKNALVPGLNRLGIKPVGVFSVTIGPQSPATYVLLPSASLETLAMADLRLWDDQEYRKAGDDFLKIPAKDPAYVRVESSLMAAFEGKPTLVVPPVTADHGERLFELRTYESATDQDHRRKVEMFHSGEFDIFQRAGFWQVFYGDTLIGPNLPNLTYMIGFKNMADRDAKWKAFFTDPQWVKLSHSEKFSFEAIVSNVTNYVLTPAAFSQI
ncbi:MAG TPA: NIPSNAP family protein [Bryobacteraceae bacterium]|nr:NIPSNAP family protein [Bryobacteraceae bacterium]